MDSVDLLRAGVDDMHWERHTTADWQMPLRSVAHARDQRALFSYHQSAVQQRPSKLTVGISLVVVPVSRRCRRRAGAATTMLYHPAFAAAPSGFAPLICKVCEQVYNLHGARDLTTALVHLAEPHTTVRGLSHSESLWGLNPMCAICRDWVACPATHRRSAGHCLHGDHMSYPCAVRSAPPV